MVEEELDETMHWLDIIMRSELMKVSRLEPLSVECKELLSIIVKSITTAKVKLKANEIAK